MREQHGDRVGSEVEERKLSCSYYKEEMEMRTWKVTVHKSTGNCMHGAMGFRREEKGVITFSISLVCRKKKKKTYGKENQHVATHKDILIVSCVLIKEL